MNEVKQEIYKMLTENTGRHMLDSGGAYGRNWERNQVKTQQDFENEKEIEWNGFGYTINLYHWLSEQLKLDSICKKFNSINVESDNWDSEELYGVSSQAEKYLNTLDIDIGNTFNSYNGDSNLSQVIQGTHVKINGEDYIILQIHGGCDVRGGYTDARLFKVIVEYFGLEDVSGVIDGVRVDNSYNGHSLTTEDGEEVNVKENSMVELKLNIF
jgi:hypothetical protein